MNFKEFIKNEGLKKLALTKLKSASYSLLIYLFNEILSGVDEIISSKKELSLLLGWTEKEIIEGLDELQFCNMIQFTSVNGKPLRIRAQLNMENWNIVHTQTTDNIHKPQLEDATNLHPLLPSKNRSSKKKVRLIDLNIFEDPIPFPKNNLKSNKTNISETNTPHTTESPLNDLGAFREKHEVIDSKIKTLAHNEIDTIKHEKRAVTPDEELLLQILSQHPEPRKQLLYALRSSLTYPNLKFFLATAKMTAKITDVNKK